MDFFAAIVLGVVEGLTEFLPVSSTGHLTITEKLLGLRIDDPSVTAFTAVIQVGAIAAVVAYFRTDLYRFARGWLRGLVKPEHRSDFDHRMGWYVIVGSIPIGAAGLAGKELMTGPLRRLWCVAGALMGCSVVMVVAERGGTQRGGAQELDLR